MSVVDACIDASRRMINYRDFVIEEAYVPGKGIVWQWAHEDYCHDATPQSLQATGTCQTMFECIDAVDAWHDHRETA